AARPRPDVARRAGVGRDPRRVDAGMAEGGSEVLVDGGVMNSRPVDLLRGFLGAGTVIASNAYGGKTDGKPMSFGDDVSGWAVLRSKLLPFGPRVKAPSLLGTLMRATPQRPTAPASCCETPPCVPSPPRPTGSPSGSPR